MKAVQEKIDESFSQKTKDNPENVDTSTITHKEAKAKTEPKAATAERAVYRDGESEWKIKWFWVKIIMI